MPVPAPLLVDARGLRCPWPVLRLARGLRDGAVSVELLSDDPAAATEIAAFAAKHGLSVVASPGRFIVGKNGVAPIQLPVGLDR